MESALQIGTCSWKFPAWRGIVYSGRRGANLLTEYAERFGCVEIDQWFWSLFGADKVALPQRHAVAEYAASVPENFRFGVKLPNALTLTHLRPERKTDPWVPNPHFLSVELLRAFMERLEPMRDKLGPLKDRRERRKRTWVFVNNHFEGCASATIDRILKLLGG